MSEYLQIQGRIPLRGTIKANGSKNAAFPILAASVLLSEPIILENIPMIEDIKCFINILISIGCKVETINQNTIWVNPTTIDSTKIDINLGRKIRGSYYFLGALLGKHSKVSIPYPGGCNIGDRGMELHFKILTELGCEFSFDEDQYHANIDPKNIKENNLINLPFPSRGATINAILFSSLQEGKCTTIKNVNLSPETSSLINFLQQAGIVINYSKDSISILGKKKITLDKFSILPDKIEIATLLVAGLMTNGEVEVVNINKDSLNDLENVFNQISAPYELKENSIKIFPHNYNLKPATIISGLISPCVDADFEPIFAPLLCLINGNSLIDDTINNERHSRFIPQLISMGADIVEISSTRAIIKGASNFTNNNNLFANDIRGGIALLLASLSASGESNVKNIFQIDRGYEKIENKLIALGAKVKRLSEK